MSTITQASVDLAVPGGPFARDIDGVAFTVDQVDFRAYDFGVYVTAFGTTEAGSRTNRSWSVKGETLPGWLPVPPAEFTALARRIAGDPDVARHWFGEVAK